MVTARRPMAWFISYQTNRCEVNRRGRLKATLLLAAILILVYIGWNCLHSSESRKIKKVKGTFFKQHNGQRQLEASFERIANIEMYVKDAFHDPRNETWNLIRVLALTSVHEPLIHCHVKTKREVEDEVPGEGTVVEANIFVKEENIPPHCNWHPTVIECPLKTGVIPELVSISTSKRYTSNSWIFVKKPRYELQKQPSFGICVKTLSDQSDADVDPLIEWFELNKLVGVNKIIIYDTDNCSSKILSLLHHYQMSGFVDLRPWPLPVKSLDDKQELTAGMQCVQYHAEVLIRADCLYNFMDDFSHIGMIDYDEYIIPSGETLLWKDMISKIESDPKSKRFAAYCFDEACFNTPARGMPFQVGDTTLNLKSKNYLRFKNLRRINKAGHYYKPIIKTQFVTAMHIHGPTYVLKNFERKMYINSTIGKLHHYRNRCKFATGNESLMEDRIINKYDDILLRNIIKVHDILRAL